MISSGKRGKEKETQLQQIFAAKFAVPCEILLPCLLFWPSSELLIDLDLFFCVIEYQLVLLWKLWV